MDRKIKPPDLSSQRAQQSAQGELVSGTSGIGIKRLPPTTSQQDQSAKKKPKKSNNENEGDVSTIPQESDESVQYSMDRRGILRGKCLLEECDCSQYELPADSKTQLCSYCGDPPAKHLIVQTVESEKDDKEPEAQQSAQGELVSGTSGIGIKRLPPTTSQQDQSAKKKPKKSNNENEGDVSTIPQESDESAQQSAQGETSGLGPSTSQQDQSAKKKPKKSNNENEGNVSTMLQESDESECIEVEIIQKGPIAVGYGGTIKINANIISNSTGSLEVKWQKIHNNCSTTLMINCFKYSGSSCDVNNPQLVINNFDREDAGIYKVEVISPTETKSSSVILLELHGDEAEALSKEENNFLRFYYTCQKIATQAVRLIFDSKVPGHTLESFLKKHESSLTSPKCDYRCTKEQKLILFPVGHVVSADFDFTLLYKLIRNLVTTLPAPTRGWGKEPSSGDLKEGDDIERIRYSRNFLAHNTKLEICDADFSTRWTDLSQAINRLSKGSLSTEVDSMRTKKFDKCIRNEMEEDIRRKLKQMREDFIEVQNQVSDNKQNIADNKQDIADNKQNIADNKQDIADNKQDIADNKQDIADNKQNIADNKHNIADNTQNIADNKQEIHNINTRHIPLNIKKGHNDQIKNWKKEDKLFYDETGGFTAALKMVQSENYMTIIGGPGSGKTATARHIALQHEEQGWEVVPVCNIEEIIQYGDRDHKQVFVRDDVLGIHAMDMNIYNQIINYKEAIFKAIGGTSKLLFTCKKPVYKESFKLGLFVTENVVDLQSKDNQLTETEKMAICKYHCEAEGVNPDLYTSLSFTKANHMFPFLCKQFSRKKEYQQLGERFFNEPSECFIIELDTLQCTNTIQYAVLVMCLVNGNKLLVDDLPPEHKRKEVFDYCGVNLGTSVKQIKDAIYHMSETYFTKLETEYTLSNDFIFEVIAYHYGRSQNGRQNQEQILECLPSSYIANKITVYEQDSNEDLCIHISEDMYLPLAKRLYRDIQSMNLFDVFMNKSLKHGPFLDVFEEMLKTKPFGEFESLILRKHGNIPHFLQKTFSSNDPIQNETEIMRLYLLFDIEFSEKSDIEPSVRVISWIINYGHTHLLKEIVKHVECNKHSISLIFGSSVMENTRLLLLGCYSNTLDMVELILKYVDSKCIDMECGASSSLNHNVHRLYTPLMVACLTGNLHIVKALLRNNAEVNKCYHFKDESVEARRHEHMHLATCVISDIADTLLRSKIRRSPLLIASEKGHCEIVKYLVAQKADVNLTDSNNTSPLYSAVEKGYYDIVEFLLQNGADVNIRNSLGYLPLYTASSSGHCAIFKLLIAHGALGAGNANSQSKTISKRTNGNEILEDSNALHNPYPEEKVNRSKEEQEKEKEGETTFTREQEEKEKIIYTRETKEENEEAIARRKEQIEKVVFGNTRKEEGKQVEENHLGTYSITLDALLPDYGNMSPLSFAVENGNIDIVKYILENITDFDLSNMGKPPLFLAAEKGYHHIIDLLLHSEYNDITQTYLDTTPLEIAVWRNNTKVVQLLIQEENKLQKYKGNKHLFKILVDLKRSTFCIDEGTDMLYCHVKDRNHHLPHSLWRIITEGSNDYLTHLLQIGLDINKRNYKGDTLLYRILNKRGVNDKFKSLMEHFEDVNAGETKWISLLQNKREDIRRTQDLWKNIFPRISDLHNVRHKNDILSECRRHIRRHSFSGISDLHNVRHAKSAQTNGFPC